MDFIQTYIIDPIYSEQPYNIFNTALFAIIALILVYLIERLYRRQGIEFMDREMILNALPFAIFGGLKRAIVDAVSKGKLGGGIYEYYKHTFWNVTPGIYLEIAGLFLFLYYLEHRHNLKGLTLIIGISLAFLHLMLAFPAIERLDPLVPVLLLAFLPAIFLGKDWLEIAAIFGQALDGATTFIATEFYGYGEKHVIASLIGGTAGYFLFYLLKIAIVLVIMKWEGIKRKEREILLGFAAILGLGIGIRNLFRLMMGV